MQRIVPPLLLALLVLAAGPARADEPGKDLDLGFARIAGDGPSHIEGGVGVFDAFEEFNGERSGAVHLQYRHGQKWKYFGPAAGMMLNADGGLFGYLGAYSEIEAGNWIATPMAGMGGYRQGDSKDLGGVFQFRLGLGLSYRFQDDSRLGVSVGHISNAGIHDGNPGEEELYFTYTLPLNW